MGMDGPAYRETVRRAREHIERGTAEDLKTAEEELGRLRRIFPKQMEYICAVVALMIARGEDGAKCRHILDHTAQEYYSFPVLADVFELKSRTFPEGTPEWRQTKFSSAFYQNGILPQEAFVQLNERKVEFLAEPSNPDLMRSLAEAYYVTRNMLAYFILMMAYCRMMEREDYDNLLVEDTGIPYPDPVCRGNFGFLLRMFTDGNSNLFLLIGTEEDTSDQQVLSRALRILGQQSILIRETSAVETVKDLNTYALHCIREARAEEEQIVLDAGKYRHADGREESAVPTIVRLLSRSTEQEAPLIVFARDNRMNGLHMQEELGGDIQRLSYCLPPQFSYGFGFAWTGDYLKYISYLYGEQVEPLLDAPASCDFSIVIPVRNSANTLRYTVETCLAIDYDGSYEIVISDNSDPDHIEVRRFIDELNDPRVRYYKTPFVLPLDKSFEYAYLHAHGAFIFSLGADDGVLPWALRYIKQAMKDYPSASFFSWRRDYFLWPGSAEVSVQRIQFFEKDVSEQYMAYPLRGEHAGIIANIKAVLYRIPLFYINSGFRHGYLREVLRKTGRIIDGGCQDIYMGAVNLLLQKECVEIQCPLTIAGMSGHSIGGASANIAYDVAGVPPAQPNVPLRARLGEYVPRGAEMAIPYIITADTFIFYMTLCRFGEFGIPMNFRPEVGYTDLADHIFLTDLRFERFWGLLLYASTLCSSFIHDQCLSFYERVCSRLEQINNPSGTVPHIKQGYSEQDKMITLDPTAFGCHNIADAARFEAQLLNL